MSTRVENNSANAIATSCVAATSICKRFGAVEALQQVTLDVGAGQTVALIGANGSGKSTLLRTIFGICRPDSGTVSVHGIDPFVDPKRLYAFAKYLSQQFSLDHEMRGDETLKLFARLNGIPGRKINQAISDVAQQFGLVDFLSRRIAKWSGGMKQRLHLAICLLGESESESGESKLMLLDEPTSNLDHSGKMDFWTWSKTYTEKGGTILLTTHDLKNVERFASKVILLDKGKVLLDETPQRIVQQHGRPVIFVTVGEHQFSQETKASLEALASVSEIDFSDNQLAIVLEDGDCKDATIVSELEKHNVPVESYRREVGLAAAYYLLAGKRLTNSQPTKRNRGSGKGRKHQ